MHIVAPLTWFGYLTGALCCVCAFLNILRFIPLFGYHGVETEVEMSTNWLIREQKGNLSIPPPPPPMTEVTVLGKIVFKPPGNTAEKATNKV